MHQDWIQDVGEGRKHSAHGRIDILFRCQLQDKQRRQVAGVRLVRDAAPSILEPWGCILLPPLRTHLVQRGPSSSCPGRSPPLRVLRRVLHQVLVLHSVPTALRRRVGPTCQPEVQDVAQTQTPGGPRGFRGSAPP
ncbi:unnamed protein product [Prorocentrum cordatum]|uniref:Uncharacterized protein n=1 Tax=Prorocentrum cordatum TaxID=2364126 RepID=A0ABN9PIN5_9DINO|nr:unnamed protein product [Polarella glacialis]